MANDKNNQVIVAFFSQKLASDEAIRQLKEWDGVNDEIKLGAIGTIFKENGKVKTQVGRKTGKGAVAGTVIGVIAAILSGGITLIGGMAVGAAGGGVVGAFMKKSTHLSKEEIQQIGNEVDAGRVAVVVSCDEDEVAPTRQQLIDYGGTVRNYTVPQEAIADAAKAVPDADAAAVEAAPAEVVTAALAETSVAEAASAEAATTEAAEEGKDSAKAE